jgi:hypothetical protein
MIDEYFPSVHANMRKSLVPVEAMNLSDTEPDREFIRQDPMAGQQYRRMAGWSTYENRAN